MNKAQLKKYEAMKKKVGCSQTDCGKKFTFSINENVLALEDLKKHIYYGHCSECLKSIKLNGDNLLLFQQIYGKTNIQILQSTFGDMFETIAEKSKK